MVAWPLLDWAEALLGEPRLAEAGLIDAERVRQAWQEHLNGRRNWQYLIWNVLMPEAWRRQWTRSPVAREANIHRAATSPAATAL